MTDFIDYRIRVILQDNKTYIGQLKAFDKHKNLVLVHCAEFRRRKPRDGEDEGLEETRQLGFVFLSGHQLVSMSVESPPPTNQGDGPRRVPRAASPRDQVRAPKDSLMPPPRMKSTVPVPSRDNQRSR